MSAHTVNRELGEAVRLGFGVGRNPGTGNTLDLEGKSGIVFVLSAGTYTVPNATAGTEVKIIATGSVVIRTVASASAILTISNGGSGVLLATTATTWSAVALQAAASAELPVAKLTTSATTTAVTPGAGALTGARHVFWENTADGALEVTTRTGTQLFGDVSGAYAGMTYLLTIINRGNNTVTLTGGSDVTVVDENTIATLVTRTYIVTLVNTTAVTMECVSKGTIET